MQTSERKRRGRGRRHPAGRTCEPSSRLIASTRADGKLPARPRYEISHTAQKKIFSEDKGTRCERITRSSRVHATLHATATARCWRRASRSEPSRVLLAVSATRTRDAMTKGIIGDAEWTVRQRRFHCLITLAAPSPSDLYT